MDNTIIELLAQDIRLIKWILAAILVVFTVSMTVMFIMIYLIKKASVENFILDNFRDKAGDLLDRNDLEGVVKLAGEKIKEYPNDVYAHWYLAQAYFLKKEWRKALEEFNVIGEISPTWRDEHIEPYVYEIKQKLQNSKPEIVKNDKE